ncbi:hypothetical protein [Methylobacterium sp. J-090]|nr:hypothetical protein [Methylobacterium sp. J-090]MCJ2083508.1 hypothetical protein [Methylobacterium sp. J-090]
MARVLGTTMPRSTAGRSPTRSRHRRRFRDDRAEVQAVLGNGALPTPT